MGKSRIYLLYASLDKKIGTYNLMGMEGLFMVLKFPSFPEKV